MVDWYFSHFCDIFLADFVGQLWSIDLFGKLSEYQY